MAGDGVVGPTSDDLVALEEEGWRALASPDPVGWWAGRLDDGARMVFPGFVATREQALQAMADALPWSWFRLDDVQVLPLGDDAAVVVYDAAAQREGQPEYRALMSSTWVRRAGEWRLALHQQTPVPAGSAGT